MQVQTETAGAINVVRTGPRGGSPLVFLHSVGLDSSWWDAQIDTFRDRFDVVAIDMPGHGLSDDMHGAPTFEALAKIVQDVLQTLDVEPAHIVGLSVGGMIAQLLAITSAHCARSLTLVGTACSIPDEMRGLLRERARVAKDADMALIAKLTIERWFTADFREARPDVIDRATISLLHRDQKFHSAMWEMVAGLSLEDQISSITCPTLVVVGEQDISSPPPAAMQIARGISASRLEIMAGVGHFPPVERPAAFNALLNDFLLKIET